MQLREWQLQNYDGEGKGGRMTTETKNRVLLGEGMLNWPRGERVGDRYGLVHVQERGTEGYDAVDGNARYMQEVPASRYASMAEAAERAGQVGMLVAEVVATRQSGHIGDFFHGFFPETPEAGEEIVLGRGELFTEVSFSEGGGDVIGVGVKPTEALGAREFEGMRIGPDIFWMNPRALYRCHEQTVRLWFVPDEVPE